VYSRLMFSNVRSASQNTYKDHDLPTEIRINRRPHPLFGQKLKVLRLRKKGKTPGWIVQLPDESRTWIPVAWTDHPTNTVSIPSTLPNGIATPGVLRDLADLLETLVNTSPITDAVSDPPLRGDHDEHATAPVRSAGTGLGQKNLEQHEPGKSTRDCLHAGRDRQNRPGTQTPHTRKGSKG